MSDRSGKVMIALLLSMVVAALLLALAPAGGTSHQGYALMATGTQDYVPYSDRQVLPAGSWAVPCPTPPPSGGYGSPAAPPPINRPAPGPHITPAPSLSYAPKGYGMPLNPRLTPTPAPSGGASYSHEYGLPYHAVSTPTPAPSGGAVPVQKYGQVYNPRVYPTPVPPSTLPQKTNLYKTPAGLSQPRITNPSRR